MFITSAFAAKTGDPDRVLRGCASAAWLLEAGILRGGAGFGGERGRLSGSTALRCGSGGRATHRVSTSHSPVPTAPPWTPSSTQPCAPVAGTTARLESETRTIPPTNAAFIIDPDGNNIEAVCLSE